MWILCKMQYALQIAEPSLQPLDLYIEMSKISVKSHTPSSVYTTPFNQGKDGGGDALPKMTTDGYTLWHLGVRKIQDPSPQRTLSLLCNYYLTNWFCVSTRLGYWLTWILKMSCSVAQMFPLIGINCVLNNCGFIQVNIACTYHAPSENFGITARLIGHRGFLEVFIMRKCLHDVCPNIPVSRAALQLPHLQGPSIPEIKKFNINCTLQKAL